MMDHTPAIEIASTREIRNFQEARLRELLSSLAERSPFYRNHFKKFAVDPSSIRTLDDLVLIPPTTKDDLQLHNMDFLAVSPAEVREYMSTSGTLGKPVTIALTANDLERLAYNEKISFACAGGTNADVFQLMLTLDRQFMAGIAYYEGVRQLGAAVVRTGPGLPAMQLDSIVRLKPTVLVCVPSFLVRLIEFAAKEGFDLSSTAVRSVVCIGEAIRQTSFELNTLGTRIREAWDIRLYGTYASTEMQTAFTECSHGKGGHLHPELVILEILDDQNRPTGPGIAGEVTVTTLGIEGMPLLRYKTGDIAQYFDEPCACGRNTIRVGPVLGRKQQLIKLKGTTIYPTGLFEILNQAAGVKDYAVEAYTSGLGTDEIRLYVLPAGESGTTVGSLSDHFQSRLRVVPEIRIATAAELEAMQQGGRKISRFIDRRTR